MSHLQKLPGVHTLVVKTSIDLYQPPLTIIWCNSWSIDSQHGGSQLHICSSCLAHRSLEVRFTNAFTRFLNGEPGRAPGRHETEAWLVRPEKWCFPNVLWDPGSSVCQDWHCERLWSMIGWLSTAMDWHWIMNHESWWWIKYDRKRWLNHGW